MPFVETYAVKFSTGNLLPHVNVNNWPDMELSTPTDSTPDSSGLTLEISRQPPDDPGKRNSVFVVPPGGVPLDSRLLMRLTFDRPRAIPQGVLLPGVLPPEPWAVALHVSPANDLLGDRMVHVTCQFNRRFDGVRLNTPTGLQTDQAGLLESPLDFDRYQGGPMVLPDGTVEVVEPPIFTLEHSFCGRDTAANKHVVGSGRLAIARTSQPEVRDHRVYSSDALRHAGPPVSSIGALGVSLGTIDGIGTMKVRLRTFSVWFNASLSA